MLQCCCSTACLHEAGLLTLPPPPNLSHSTLKGTVPMHCLNKSGLLITTTASFAMQWAATLSAWCL